MRSALVVTLVLSAACGKLDRKQLSGQVHQLRAYAAEANLLRAQRDAGDTPRAYARVQRLALVAKIYDATHELDRGAEPALDPDLRAAQVLGSALAHAVRVEDPVVVDLEARLAVLDEVLRP